MAIFNYLKFPFKNFFIGLQSYRFFNALEKKNDKKVLKIIQNSRNFFDLQEIYSHFSPLHVLIREGKHEMIEKVIQRPDISKFVGIQNNPMKLAPVHVAAKYGTTWLLPEMAKLRCNLMAKTEQGTSAIHIAAAEGFNDFISQLLELGVQIDDQDKVGFTALFYAVLFSKIDTVRLLLEKGAKSGSMCEVGSTPLLNAVLKGDLEIIRLLYRFRDGHKFRAPYKLVHVASGLPSAEAVRWLHEQGEDIRDVDASVRNNQDKRLGCLHYAAAGKSAECLKYLLKQGLFVDFTDRTESTALHTSVIQSDYESARLLCEAGARIDIKNSSFLTPLDIAESMRDAKMVSCLKQFLRTKAYK